MSNESLANSWHKLLIDEDPDLPFEGLTAEDLCAMLNCGGENSVTVDDVKEWFGDNDADLGTRYCPLKR